MVVETIRIDERFRGPPRSGNGGYVCGRTAARLPGTVAVRLKAPPPLDADLRLETGDAQARLLHGERPIAEARAATLELDAPPPPTLAQAQAASPAYLGFQVHAFPGCFVCGPQRAPGDGLRIFPGSVEGSTLIAAPWTPDASLVDASGAVRSEFLWAALDCTSGFAIMPPPEGSALVLGELCATLHGGLRAGDACLTVGWPVALEGRKRHSGSAVYRADGSLVALARAVWIEVPLSQWA